MQRRTTEPGWREPLQHPAFEHGISGMIDIFVLLHGILEDCHTENQRQGLACDKLIDDRMSSPHLASSGFCSNPAPSTGRSVIISDQWYNSHDQWCSCPTYHTSTESYVIVMLGMFLQSTICNSPDLEVGPYSIPLVVPPYWMGWLCSKLHSVLPLRILSLL